MRKLAFAAVLLPCLGWSQTFFSFDDAPQYTSLPVSVTADGITATLTGTGQSFSIQAANVLGFTPQGFSGKCIYPNSIYAADLIIDFSTNLSEFSIMFSPEEYGSDTSATMRAIGYLNGTMVGYHDNIAPVPGTWPTGTLTYSNYSQNFDRIVVHYQAPPVNGENWGPIFMADNMTIRAVPEPATLATLLGGLAILRLRHKRA